MSIKIVAKNKKAYFDYEIVDKIEAGLALIGCEVKSIRKGDISLRDGYARIDNGQIILMGCYIAPYNQGGQFTTIDPSRNRKVLLHKKEILRWQNKVNEKGFTVTPLKIYLKRHLVKIELGLAKAKKVHDKRESIKNREHDRELSKALKY